MTALSVCVVLATAMLSCFVFVLLLERVIALRERIDARRREADGREDKPLYICSDNVVRTEAEAIAYEADLYSGEPPEAPWSRATTRMRRVGNA